MNTIKHSTLKSKYPPRFHNHLIYRILGNTNHFKNRHSGKTLFVFFLLILLFSPLSKTIKAQTTLQNYDLVFGQVSTSDEACDLKKTDVKIVNIDAGYEKWYVDRIHIYIKYTESENITIDEEATSNSLNQKIKDNYEGIDVNAIVTYDSQNGKITIKAKKQQNGLWQSIEDITDLITIYFKGEPSTHVIFSFEYNNPQTNFILRDYDEPNDIYTCIPVQSDYDPTQPPYIDITCDYTFDDATKNYDLAFSEVSQSYDCQQNKIDAQIVNINEDDEEWEVENLDIYIHYYDYDNSGKDITILQTELNSDLEDNYEPENGSDIVTFPQNGIIAINAKLKPDGDKQKIKNISDLLSIFFTGASSTSVKFEFIYFLPDKSKMLLNNGNNECFTCVPYQYPYNPDDPDNPIDYHIFRTFDFEDAKENFDLSFGNIEGCTEPFSLKELPVNISNIDESDQEWDVKKLKIYINYISYYDVEINIDKTRESLNEKLKNTNKYKPIVGNYIVNYQQFSSGGGTISIEAIVKNEDVNVKFKEITDLITVYFSAEPQSVIHFSFPKVNPENSVVLKNNNSNCIVCTPKYLYENNDKEVDYTVPALTNRYDLAYGEINDPEGECSLADIDVKIVDLDSDVQNWEVNTLKVYAHYNVISSNGSVNINMGNTTESLVQGLKDNYEQLYTGGIVKLFEESDHRSGTIAIRAKVKDNGTKQILDNIKDLITIYFSAEPNTQIKFTFYYEYPFISEINLCDNDINNPDSHFCYPYKINNPQQTGYYIQRQYTFNDNIRFVGFISNMSDGNESGKCNDPILTVPKQEGVTIDFYNTSASGQEELKCSSVTGGKEDMDCEGSSLYGKAKCHISQSELGDVKIVPSVDICGTHGVTTQDIVAIQKHLLGIKQFEQAYQLFAADVNNDGRITASDILKIRKVILESLPPDELGFDFIEENVFKDVECDGCDKYYIQSVLGKSGVIYSDNNGNILHYIIFKEDEISSTSPNVATFYGFKEGDVNNSCDNCDHSACVGQEGTTGDHNIIIDDISENRDTLIVSVQTDDKDSVDIIGVTLHVEPVGIELDTIITFDSDDTMPEYNYLQDRGLLKIIWQNENALKGISSTTNDIFKLKFKKGKYNASDIHLNVLKNIPGPHITVINDQSYITGITNRINPREIYEKENNFYILPTLFKDKIVIHYNTPSVQTGDLILYNNLGQQLYRDNNVTLHKGDNEYTIDKLSKLPNGVIFYRFKIGNKTFSGNLVKTIK